MYRKSLFVSIVLERFRGKPCKQNCIFVHFSRFREVEFAKDTCHTDRHFYTWTNIVKGPVLTKIVTEHTLFSKEVVINSRDDI